MIRTNACLSFCLGVFHEASGTFPEDSEGVHVVAEPVVAHGRPVTRHRSAHAQRPAKARPSVYALLRERQAAGQVLVNAWIGVIYSTDVLKLAFLFVLIFTCKIIPYF